MNIESYLDSTYLKTDKQAQISETETKQRVEELIMEAIENNFKLVMIRPKYVSMAKKLITKNKSDVLIGTVIGFHEGTFSTDEKMKEAQKAIENEVDELDFVINYKAFLEGKVNLVKSEVFKGTQLAFENDKTIKWIIEIAALSNNEIEGITQLIRNVVNEQFKDEDASKVFVKSSTGFYTTQNNKPNGATFEAMKLIIKNAGNLSVKAAGGVRNYDDAVKMIEMGVTRIGTSSAKAIVEGIKSKENY